MRVQDIIDLASVSELANTSYADNEKAILLFLNLGMTTLYSKFPILVKEHLVELAADQTVYTLPDDFISVHQVYGEVPENSSKYDVNVVPINEPHDPYSVYFPGGNIIEIPEAMYGSYISVIYQALPKRITENDLETNIALPASLFDALTTYIGFRAALGTGSGAEREDTTYFRRFEFLCEKALMSGTTHVPATLSMTPKFLKKGLA